MNCDGFETKLSQLAHLCVKVGLNLQRGQELIVTAPLEAVNLVQFVTRAAYRHGAKLVTCFYDDPEMIRDRFLYAEDETLDYAPEWIYCRMAQAFGNGAARLWIAGPYPDLLSGIQVGKILRVHSAMAQVSKPEADLISASRTNWSTLPYVTASWARQVFPGLASEEAVRNLWERVFDVTRATSADPLARWKEHDQVLKSRRQFLQDRQFEALHFYDGQTDLTVGLVAGHRWVGGATVSASGIEYHPSIPAEKVYTCPHRERTSGKVFFSRPLVLAGAIVKDLQVEFRDGLVVSVGAREGQEVFEASLSGEEGAHRLGEVGLVPHSSPISQSHLIFHSALFDENAASHVAFGQSSAICLANNSANVGANKSSIHIDCMFGNSRMNVDGLSRTGRAEPIMRGGEFSFEDCH
jgi:aminopeptidase